MPQKYDVIIIGAGAVGLATAFKLLQKKPGARLAVLEKEREPASHQTSQNSGTLHRGIYYKPGSLKAKNCVEGAKELIRFCDAHGVLYRKCGKVIVAASEDELPILQQLLERGQANGVADLKLIGPVELKEIEPHVSGLQALWSPHTATLNFASVANALVKEIERKGGKVFCNTRVKHIDRLPGGFVLGSNCGTYLAEKVVNCGGLWAGKIAEMAGYRSKERPIFFRGDFYELVPHRRYLANGLVYPAASLELPFLGVHLSRVLDGSVLAGPNACLTLSRTGYRLSPAELKDMWSTLTTRGFWNFTTQNFWYCFNERLKRFSKHYFFKELKKLVPEIEMKDLIYKGSGVRGELALPSGSLVDDFVIRDEENIIHILNAPSPAATSALSLGTLIAGKL